MERGKAWVEQTGYPLHVIKKAKHFSNGDNPEQVNNEIELFIKKLAEKTDSLDDTTAVY